MNPASEFHTQKDLQIVFKGPFRYDDDLNIKSYKEMKYEEIQYHKSFEILDRATKLEEEILSGVKKLIGMVA